MKSKKNTVEMFVLYAIMLFVAIFLIYSMFSLVITKGDYYEGNFKDTATVGDRFFSLQSTSTSGIRGNIYSDEGKVLISSIYIYDLYWYPSLVHDSTVFVQKVDTLIDLFMKITPNRERKFYEKNIKQAYLDYKKQSPKVRKELGKKFVIIKISKPTKPQEWVTDEDWNAIRALFTTEKGAHTGGCRVDRRIIHNSVYRGLARSTLGASEIVRSSKGIDSIVYKKGIESYYDHLLSGKVLEQKKLFVNRVLVPTAKSDDKSPTNGADIKTTINIDIQRVAEDALRKKVEEANASWGCVVVMEVETGEIKAIVNLTKTRNGVYTEAIDHAITERYEPGSTFKTITLLAALESGKIDTSTIVKCEKGNFSVKRAFEISDNEGTYNAAKMAYNNINNFFVAISKMSLQKDLGLEVAAAQKPMLISKTKSKIDYERVTRGYAIKVPPIYMAAYYNAIANNGKYIRPILVKSIKEPEQAEEKKTTSVVNPSICSPKTINKVKDCLESVVLYGTGRGISDNARFQQYHDSLTYNKPLIAGKTGTAFIFDDKNGQYSSTMKNSSFIGYFPSDKPKYTCLVMISGTIQDGGKVAAPVCKEIAEKIITQSSEIAWSHTKEGKMANVPTLCFGNTEDLKIIYNDLGYTFANPKGDWLRIKSANKNKTMSFNEMNFNKENLQNTLKGASAKDAVYLLEKAGYDVSLKGVGKVAKIETRGKKAVVELKN